MRNWPINKCMVVIAILSAACTTTGGVTTFSQQTRPAAPGVVVISERDLARFAQTGTMAQAIVDGWPSLLAGRGGRPVLVSVDGAPAADPVILGSVKVSTVSEVRLVRASVGASNPTGIRANGDVVAADVLFVVTRREVR